MNGRPRRLGCEFALDRHTNLVGGKIAKVEVDFARGGEAARERHEPVLLAETFFVRLGGLCRSLEKGNTRTLRETVTTATTYSA